MPTADQRPVLVAYDGSPESENALREAVALFAGRPVIVMSVWEPGLATMTLVTPPGEAGYSYRPDPADVAAIQQAEKGHAAHVSEEGAEIARRLGATAEALAVPDSVNVAEVLASVAEERDAGAIVVGSRGQHGFRAKVLGSTSRKLLHDTRRPVLVVRAP